MVRTIKVTVYFDDVGVVVPCCDHNLTVADLVELAIVRYKKALGKPSEYLVTVHNLKSASGAILDVDDRILDVIDNREQVYATFEEEDRGMTRMNRGDGTSASSIGTNSPDPNKMMLNLLNDSKMMRQASEPALTREFAKDARYDDSFEENASFSQDDTILSMKKFDKVPKRKYGSTENPHKVVASLPPLGFVRNLSTRKSVVRGNKSTVEWLDGQESGIISKDTTRSDPIGSSAFVKTNDVQDTAQCVGLSENKTKMVEFENDEDSLGIHVVPDKDSCGRSSGLSVHSVDITGKVGRDGRIREMDKIVEINGKSLSDVDFVMAQTILKEAMKADKLCLQIIPYAPTRDIESHRRIQHAHQTATSTPCRDSVQNTPNKFSCTRPSFNKRNMPSTSSGLFSTPGPRSTTCQTTTMDKPYSKTCSKISHTHLDQEIVASLPTKKIKNDTTPLRITLKDTSANKHVVFSRTPAKTQNIHLIKGCYGLGFSITTRDVPMGRNCPLFIKHILSQGAAIDDGRLQPGDKLLQVNGMDVSKRGHDGVVAYLRGIKLGGKVELLVERVITSDGSNKSSTCADGHRLRFEDRDIIHFVINLEGNLGIGMSVRGKTRQTEDGLTTDLGLFVKTIHSQGAAARDGRLKVDDRILEANGKSLLELSNAEARETLKDAMQLEGPLPNTISFLIEQYTDIPIVNDFYTSNQNDLTVDTPMKRSSSILKKGNAAYSARKSINSTSNSSELEDIRNGNDIAIEKQAVDGNDDLDTTIVCSNVSPARANSNKVFSRDAPGRQSVSEKRKNHLDSKVSFSIYNQVKLTGLVGQSHNDTQTTLKKALSAESLISQINASIVKTPQGNLKTCGLVREALKKYTSMENVKSDVINKEKDIDNKRGAKPKDSSDSSDRGRKKLKNILKGLFKTKTKKEVKSSVTTTIVENSQPCSKMIDNLLFDARSQNITPILPRNRHKRPISTSFEQEFWSEYGNIPSYYSHLNEERDFPSQNCQQPPLHNAFLPVENSRPYGGSSCYCSSYNCYPYVHPSRLKHDYHQCYIPDIPHYRTSSRHCFQTNIDQCQVFGQYAPTDRYRYNMQDAHCRPDRQISDHSKALQRESETYFDDDDDDDLNDTTSTIHHF